MLKQLLFSLSAAPCRHCGSFNRTRGTVCSRSKIQFNRSELRSQIFLD